MALEAALPLPLILPPVLQGAQCHFGLVAHAQGPAVELVDEVLQLQVGRVRALAVPLAHAGQLRARVECHAAVLGWLILVQEGRCCRWGGLPVVHEPAPELLALLRPQLSIELVVHDSRKEGLLERADLGQLGLRHLLQQLDDGRLDAVHGPHVRVGRDAAPWSRGCHKASTGDQSGAPKCDAVEGARAVNTLILCTSVQDFW